jgi:D-beta-D-heptose 7-phosphate kinase/D-beta-D-heptose 1-phosphate adenosyltransferase
MKRIWVNGAFDVLHIGHIKLLEYASSFGTLRVGIDTDERVKEKKGELRPYNSLEDRMGFMRSIRFVDSVVAFDSDETLVEHIKQWRPDIMVIGDDYQYEQIIGREYIPKIEFFKKINGISTTKILENEKI